MREMLFRAKDADGRWQYGDYIRYNEEFCNIKDTTIYRHSHLCRTKTVGQYIGLEDKNGTKIFEGDIVKRNGNFMASNYVIKYIDKFAAFIGMAHGNNEIYLHRCDEDFVVIGNIHDNPELLKEREK